MVKPLVTKPLVNLGGLLARTFLASILLFAASVGQGFPQTDPKADVDAIRDFSRQLEELKRSLSNLKNKIDDSAKAINRSPDVDTARKQIAEVTALVSTLLAAAADNGEISQLGTRALGNAQERLKHFRQNQEFSPERQEILIRHWERLTRETEQATKDLDVARTKFAELLLRLQKDDDFLVQLMRVAQAQEALETIRALVKTLTDASIDLNNFINSIAPPRPGS